MRHATAYSRKGYAGLVDELKLDVGRLGKRNLGRDDRVMAHWSREVRFPYLDEEFVKWAIELPIWLKCDFENGESDAAVEPGKRVLRLLAAELGMHDVSREKKRAVSTGEHYLLTQKCECDEADAENRSNSAREPPKWRAARLKGQRFCHLDDDSQHDESSCSEHMSQSPHASPNLRTETPAADHANT